MCLRVFSWLCVVVSCFATMSNNVFTVERPFSQSPLMFIISLHSAFKVNSGSYLCRQGDGVASQNLKMGVAKDSASGLAWRHGAPISYGSARCLVSSEGWWD